MQDRGFTLVELTIVIVIIAALSGIISLSIVQYIKSGKDANIAGNLAVLVPAGEAYYNSNNDSYTGFCSSDVVNNSKAQMPENQASICYSSPANPSGLCCVESDDQWVACVREFKNTDNAFCVDSRGYKREIDASQCASNMNPLRCPASGI